MLKLNKKYSKDILCIFSILILGLILRLLGFNHGYPFVFHPDEATIIRSSLGIRFDINPAHFDWPHLYVYFNYFLYMVFAKIRNVFSVGSFPFLFDDAWVFYPLTRIVTGILSALTIIPIYLAGKTLFNNRVGFFAALGLSIIPFHVWHSHYALTDAPMVFFLTWGLYFSSRILVNKEVSLRDYMLAGIFVGLSASTKYNGGLSALMVPLATLFNIILYIKINDIKDLFLKFILFKNITLWSLSGIFAILGFLAGTPFALLDFDTFIRTDGPQGALWQFTNVGSNTLPIHITTFINDIIFQISDDLGYTILIGFLVTLGMSIYFLFKKNTNKLPLTLYFILFMGVYLLWYIAGFEKSRSHYYMIAYPFIVLAFGYFVDLFSTIKSRYVVYFLYTIAFIIPFILSLRGSYIFYNGDTRLDLYNWLNTNITTDTPVIYDYNALDELMSSSKVSVYANGFDNIEEYSNGILILTDEDTFDSTEYTLNLLESFDNTLKRGPEILIYEFEK